MEGASHRYSSRAVYWRLTDRFMVDLMTFLLAKSKVMVTLGWFQHISFVVALCWWGHLFHGLLLKVPIRAALWEPSAPHDRRGPGSPFKWTNCTTWLLFNDHVMTYSSTSPASNGGITSFWSVSALLWASPCFAWKNMKATAIPTDITCLQCGVALFVA